MRKGGEKGGKKIEKGWMKGDQGKKVRGRKREIRKKGEMGGRERYTRGGGRTIMSTRGNKRASSLTHADANVNIKFAFVVLTINISIYQYANRQRKQLKLYKFEMKYRENHRAISKKVTCYRV